MFCYYYRERKGSAQNSGSGKIFVSSLVLNTLNYNNLVLKIKLYFSLWALRCHWSGKFILLHLASVLFCCCCCFIPAINQKIVIWLHWHVVDKRPSSTAYRCRSMVTSVELSLKCLLGQPWDTFSVDKQKACSIFNAFSPHNMQDINNGASSKHQPWLIKKFWLLIFNSTWITNMFEYPYVGLWNVTCAGFAVEFLPASAHTKTYWSSFQRW